MTASRGSAGNTPANGDITSVALFVTCVADLLCPDTAAATVRVLRAAGVSVTCPSGQTCCGQPAWNAGFTVEAAAVARTSLEALEADPAERVVVPAGSCATMIRVHWPQLFELGGDAATAERAHRLSARVVEFSEFIAGRELPPPSAGEPTKVAYHRSCHMERELGVVDEPAIVLDRVDGCNRLRWAGDDRCCGFGGTFSVRLPEVSVAMADEKLDSLPGGTDTVVGCDSSCLLHLQGRARERGLALQFLHLAEVVAAALPAESVRGDDEPRG